MSQFFLCTVCEVIRSSYVDVRDAQGLRGLTIYVVAQPCLQGFYSTLRLPTTGIPHGKPHACAASCRHLEASLELEWAALILAAVRFGDRAHLVLEPHDGPCPHILRIDNLQDPEHALLDRLASQ